MSRLTDPEETEEIEIRSAADLLPLMWSADLPDYALDLRWSPDGSHLAALPSTGMPGIHDRKTNAVKNLPAHSGGNGSIAWHPQGSILATFGQDGILRLHDISSRTSRELQLPRGWTGRCAWNADGSLIAAAVGKAVHVIDPHTLETLQIIDDHRSTVTDLVWHPVLSNQLGTASDGGARMWRIGEKKPFARIDDGVAAVLTTWSPDGRWLVTSDQSPSVHLYDLKKRAPLFIQGFETKIKAIAWQTGGTSDLPWLALGGRTVITVWPCFGKNGPRGAKPIQLYGHLKEVSALDFPIDGPYLASGARDGLVFLWLPHHSNGPALIAREESEITTVRWSPDGLTLAYGTASGRIAIHTLSHKV
ncbi:MAG: WD40 repeat domain-containing protein [Luteolibacter sp.]|jgi:WD40 repeat protein|nr:WD40 repeat domain-containing protein [Luteolibacter sp.]